MLAAHLVASGPDLRGNPDRQQTRKETTAQSLAASKGEVDFVCERQEIAALLDVEGDEYPTRELADRARELWRAGKEARGYCDHE
jgi:hypothetical protein